jgi:hypothetical protein
MKILSAVEKAEMLMRIAIAECGEVKINGCPYCDQRLLDKQNQAFAEGKVVTAKICAKHHP